MAAVGGLTDPDVTALRGEVSTGRPVTVWFSAAAVGVPEGGSAKVVSVGDAADGDFIQVRPAGTRDTMFCAPNELTRTRPSRRRDEPGAAARAAAAKPAVAAQSPVAGMSSPVAAKPAAAAARPAAAVRVAAAAQAPTGPVPTAPVPTAPVPTAPVPTGPAVAVPTSTGEVSSPPEVTRARAARPRRRVDPTGEMAVTLTATAEGEWTVEVRVGSKRIVAATPVPAADVATAARSLPAAVAEAIESSLEGARQRQRDRVEQLRADLDAAQQVLDQLGV